MSESAHRTGGAPSLTMWAAATCKKERMSEKARWRGNHRAAVNAATSTVAQANPWPHEYEMKGLKMKMRIKMKMKMKR